MSNDLFNITTKRLNDLFHLALMIPGFQRPYKWGTLNVHQLIDDTYERFKSGSRYFLGNIILFDDTDKVIPNTYETWYGVVDGQQRVTTLQMLFLAGRDLIEEVDTEEPTLQVLRSVLKVSIYDNSSTNHAIPRLHAINPASRYVISRGIDGLFPTAAKDLPEMYRTQEARNLANSYVAAKARLRKIFSRSAIDPTGPVDVPALCRFLHFLLNRVQVATYIVSSIEEAIEIFERCNDRGMPLEQIDMLKTRFIRGHASDPHFYEQWNQMIESLPSGRGDDFLRYYLAYRTNELSSAKRILTAVDAAEKKGHFSFRHQDGVLLEMTVMAQLYRHFSDFKGPGGRAVPGLSDLQSMPGNRRQQALFLMAGAHLEKIDPALFDALADEIAKLFFVSSTAGILPNEHEADYLEACELIKCIADSDDFETVMDSTIRKLRKDFEPRFRTGFPERTRYTPGTRGRPSEPEAARYAVRRIGAFVQSKLEGKDVEITRMQELEVEHILPKASPNVEDMFDTPDEHRSWLFSLGNLTLLSKGDNAKAGNDPLFARADGEASKRDIYARSGIGLTQLIVDPASDQRKGTALTLIGDILTPVAEWGPEQIRQRHAALTEIAVQTWVL